jgi:hypothetical protein
MAKIKVKGTEISVITINNNDYISLTDMLKAKDGDFFISDWLRNRNTVEFLGIWEKSITQILIMANSPQLKVRPV